MIAAYCEEYREGQQMLAASFVPPQALATQQKGQHARQSRCLTSLRSNILALDILESQSDARLLPVSS